MYVKRAAGGAPLGISNDWLTGQPVVGAVNEDSTRGSLRVKK